MSTSFQSAHKDNARLIDVVGTIIDEGDYVENDIECVHPNNEDMKSHMGKWLNNLYSSKTLKESKDDNEKGKKHA